MDDEHICPICCEELDVTDRQFFPCKCGYQVCMWCWHRIRSEVEENEVALCPACRTPYGDDPHQFTAMDIEDVIKANREREKKEKGYAKAEGIATNEHHFPALGDAAALPNISMNGSAPAIVVSSTSGSALTGAVHKENIGSKDRSQLANMRVIRRDLVYAVGLPTNIANEELLKKPEYFGQYGKIQKIVLNRSSNSGNDPRRATASAYVTFAHKEDTLTCILALDGYHFENRNIRASFGTSKYCSAFVKNMKCSNPECTYLHVLGEAEDTFTKQEIQAGYVTSGRDVLAKQHQQKLNSSNIKQKVGGGGPSGSGKAASNPVFPPPVYDEPTPKRVQMKRASSLGNPIPTAKPSMATTLSGSGTGKKTAASIVASSIAVPSTSSQKPPPPTLVPLKPMKSMPRSSSLPTNTINNNVKRKTPLTNESNNGDLPKGNTGVTSFKSDKIPDNQGSSLIGGSLIIGNSTANDFSNSLENGSGIIFDSADSSFLAPKLDDAIHLPKSNEGDLSWSNPLPPTSKLTFDGGDIWSSNQNQSDKWSSHSSLGDPFAIAPGLTPATNGGLQNPNAPNSFGASLSSDGSSNIWGSSLGSSLQPEITKSSLNYERTVQKQQSENNLFSSNSGSSALASMLGIRLPTGSGSLSDTSKSFVNNSNTNGSTTASQSPWNTSSLTQSNNSFNTGGVIGSNNGVGSLGGVSVGGLGTASNQPSDGNIGNDIALLRSLLPGVHITSGNASQPGGWGEQSWNQQSEGQLNKNITGNGLFPNNNKPNNGEGSASQYNTDDPWAGGGLYTDLNDKNSSGNNIW